MLVGPIQFIRASLEVEIKLPVMLPESENGGKKEMWIHVYKYFLLTYYHYVLNDFQFLYMTVNLESSHIVHVLDTMSMNLMILTMILVLYSHDGVRMKTQRRLYLIFHTRLK